MLIVLEKRLTAQKAKRLNKTLFGSLHKMQSGKNARRNAFYQSNFRKIFKLILQ